MGSDVWIRGDRPRAGRGRGRQRRASGSSRGSKDLRAARLLCDDGRLPADHERSAVLGEHLDRLSGLNPEDSEAIGAQRRDPPGDRSVAIPDDQAAAITGSLSRSARRGLRRPSSATAEDLPDGLFAGQHDTYLNVVGSRPILRHVTPVLGLSVHRKGRDLSPEKWPRPPKVHMAVVVQRMVFSEAAGVLFTADPVTSNRKSFRGGQLRSRRGPGLGSGERGRLQGAERRGRRQGHRRQTARDLRLADSRDPGTDDRTGAPEPARIDGRAGRAARAVGPADRGALRPPPGCRMVPRRWRLPDRPEPADHHALPHPRRRRREARLRLRRPSANDDGPDEAPGALRVAADGFRPMYDAGGRLFVDVISDLASPARGASSLEAFGRSDPLTGDALRTLLDAATSSRPSRTRPGGPPAAGAPAPIETDPAIVTELIERSEASIATLKRDIQTKSGAALLDFIMADIGELKRILFDPQSHQVFMSAMEATWWLNEKLEEWLGEKNAADTLTLSVPHNVTSEMGLALLDVADAIRPHPEVIAFLQHDRGRGFPGRAGRARGRREARDAIAAFLDRFGMRCVGEIDITRPRWSEHPTTLVPLILEHVKNFEPGAAARRFEQGRQQAREKEQDLLGRLRGLPDGERKADETKRMIDRVRTFIGYREYPKYGMVCRYFVYKQASLEEAGRLVRARAAS